MATSGHQKKRLTWKLEMLIWEDPQILFELARNQSVMRHYSASDKCYLGYSNNVYIALHTYCYDYDAIRFLYHRFYL